MKRRAFIAALGSATATWPLAARGQQASPPLVGFLAAGTPGQRNYLMPAVTAGLREAGQIVGQNVAIEYRWAEGQYERLPGLAAELVRRRPAVVIADGITATLAAKDASGSIPVVFMIGRDPVQLGLAGSLSRPGANFTGFVMLTVDLTEKRLELARELVPAARTIALLANSASPQSADYVAGASQAARVIGVELDILTARTASEIDAVFTAMARAKPGALVVQADPFLDTRREQILALAAHYAIPACYGWREFPDSGGLMSYGANIADVYRQTGVYAGKIIAGAKPAELPIQQPTRLELVINMKTAKALGIEVPQSIMVRADEVIE